MQFQPSSVITTINVNTTNNAAVQLTGVCASALILLLIHLAIPVMLLFIIVASMLISVLWWRLMHLVSGSFLHNIIDYISLKITEFHQYFDDCIAPRFLELTGMAGITFEQWILLVINKMIDTVVQNNDENDEENNNNTDTSVGGLIPIAPPLHQYNNNPVPRYHPVVLQYTIKQLQSDWELV